jgi:hypothetical protein
LHRSRQYLVGGIFGIDWLEEFNIDGVILVSTLSCKVKLFIREIDGLVLDIYK